MKITLSKTISNTVITGSVIVSLFTVTTAHAEQDMQDHPSTHHAHKGGHHDGFFPKHPGKRHEKMAAMMLEKIDTNEDGQVDLTEFLAHAEQRFHSMDIDGNGYATPEEAKEAGKIMREKHHEMMKEAHKKAAEAE